MKKTTDKTHKWEFGMYPISKEMSDRYEKSIFRIIKFLNDFIIYNKVLDDFSELKGMLNRTVKKNQLDWFTVYEKLHYPNERELVGVIFLITELRNLLKNNNSLEEFKQNEKIFLCYLKKLIENYNSKINAPEEYLYILSLKNEPDILKIGMTTGKVSKRVNQINSSTGVLNPYGVRKVFKVKNCKVAERESHLILSDYRIRKDREFFKIPFAQALDLIEKSFTQNGLKIRNIGKIIYFNPASKIGKIKYCGIENIEFSKEDLVFENETFEIGNLVEYDINIVKKKLKKIVKNTVYNTV
ncbi:GIY-YIG nuclease family protein [Polaribacter haliotis]|uniref:GIY-YIG nuclease family protein n=1 Tax=Polaribacter haliotis TaxID=1888915 RepID=A0A7L8ABK2_9FLAO|nr:GIY-YIG nuclease family protein [Polaribacter haliotis]QOD59362.1 GIY-YIG nuclease family protein [Polaribacter haliotis]